MIKSNKKDFIKKSNEIHGNRYDYSLVEYINNSTKVRIVCPVHGVFLKTPVKHINSKQGCKNCSVISMHENQRKNTDVFISESKIVHGSKYDYSLVEYNTNRHKVKIICHEHGIFEQAPSNHLKGRGCMYCGGTSKLDTNLFIYKSKKYILNSIND